MDKVDKLYENYYVLSDTSNEASEREAAYLEIVQSAKGESSEKMLAAQFIPRFFKEFPHLAENALDAQLDLVEDLDVNIRKHAIKYLPSFCKETREYITKVAELLTQVLQTEDTSELATVHSSLMTLLELDVQAALQGLFLQISSAEYEIIRKRAIHFLCGKFKFLPSELITKEVQELLLLECKKIFQEATGEEFLNLMSLLSNLKIAKTIRGQQALVDLVGEQIELDKPFDATIPENIVCLLQCLKHALLYFSPFVSSARFVSFICLQVLPKLEDIMKLDKGEDMNLELIKLFAEMVPFATNLENIKECIDLIYENLLKYIPVPPLADTEINTSEIEPDLQFTHIECFMFIFTRLLKEYPEFLMAPENAERFKDLKARMQFLARRIQHYLKTVKNSLYGKKEEISTEENKVKAIALRTLTNINTFIKDLFRQPFSFKSAITLSWKSPVAPEGIKREHSPVSEPERSKKEVKAGRELYAPPGGKYSKNVNLFPQSRSSNYYPRGRGRRFY